MSVTTPVSKSHPLMIAWTAHKQSEAYANTLKWAGASNEGNLWACFEQGWRAATERAAALHESMDVASDSERLGGVPGSGAMGAIVGYRDAIRADH